MKRLVWLVLLLPGSLLALDTVDYSTTPHWAGGVYVAEGLGDMYLRDGVANLLGPGGMLHRVDISDPFHPTVMSAVSLGDSTTRVFGPFAGILYAVSDGQVTPFDAVTFASAGSPAAYPEVTCIAARDSLGVMLTHGGSELVLFDPRESPAQVLGSVSLGTNREYSAACFFQDFVVLSRSWGKSLVVDVANPAFPVVRSDIGYVYYDWMGGGDRSTSISGSTYGAVAHDFVYTLEYQSTYDSGTGHSTYRKYVHRWSLADPDNPVVLESGYPATYNLTSGGRAFHRQDHELVVTVGSRLVYTNLLDPELDDTFVLSGLAGDIGVSCLDRAEEKLVAYGVDGTLNVVLMSQPTSEYSTNFLGRIPGPAAIGPGFFAAGRYVENTDERYFAFTARNITDPDAPATLYDMVFPGDKEPRWAFSPGGHAVVADPGGNLISIPEPLLEGTSSTQGQASDFAFLDDRHGVSGGSAGLQVFDTADPGAFVLLATPSDSVTREVTALPPGSAGSTLCAGLTQAGTVSLWNLDAPGAPSLVGELQPGWEGFVDTGGRGAPLLFGYLRGSGSWPGYSLQVVDAGAAGPAAVAGSLALPDRPHQGWLRGSMLYLACGNAGLLVVDMTSPQYPAIHGGFGIDPVTAIFMENERLILGGADVVALWPDAADPLPTALVQMQLRQESADVVLEWCVDPSLAQARLRLLAIADEGTRLVPIHFDGLCATARDAAAGPGMTTYQLEIRRPGQEVWTVLGTRTRSAAAPAARLLAPVPNPFNARVTISCQTGMTVGEVLIYDLAGRLVRTLRLDSGAAGSVEVNWDGKDGAGQACPSGTYLVRLVTDAGMDQRKMMLVR